MKVLSVNGGVIFYTQNSDTKIHIDYMIRMYNLVYSSYGFFLPKSLTKLLFGYREVKGGDGSINYYDYYFNNLHRFKLVFDVKKAKLVDFNEPNKSTLATGLYYTRYDNNGVLQNFEKYENIQEEPIKLLAQPTHAELLNTIEVLENEIKFAKLENTRIVEANTVLVNELNSVKESINNIASTIKTIPAVAGSPLNPALVTNLIVNPALTFENQANIYEDLVADSTDGNNYKRDKCVVKLLETSSDIKGK